MTRPSWDQYFFEMAKLVSTRGTCNRKRVGAVIVRDNQVLATGYNGSPRGKPHCDDLSCPKSCFREPITENVFSNDGDAFCPVCEAKLIDNHEIVDGHCVRTVHAELNAILQAARHGVSIDGASLYITCFPCYDCGKAIANVGIIKVYHGEFYNSRYNMSANVPDFLKSSGIEVIHI